MNMRTHVACAALSLLGAIAFTPAAFAAGATGTGDAAAAPAAPQDTLNDIIVTAQRKAERLQDVGISVTALATDQLKQMDVNNATDLVRAVPSLKLNAFSSSAVVWNVRGVSQNDYGDQQEPPVAVYQDDSYSSSINTASFPIFDLARRVTRPKPSAATARVSTKAPSPVHCSTICSSGLRGSRTTTPAISPM